MWVVLAHSPIHVFCTRLMPALYRPKNLLHYHGQVAERAGRYGTAAVIIAHQKLIELQIEFRHERLNPEHVRRNLRDSGHGGLRG